MIKVSEEKIKRWSYSRISGDCLYAFYRTYILGDRGEPNAFSQYGTIAHELLKDYHDGKLFQFEVADKYEKQFKNIMQFPPNKYVSLRDSYFEAGKRFFEKFDEYFKDYDIIETEQEHDIKIYDIPFVAIPDFVGRHKKTGKIHILDYKSSKPFTKDDYDKKIKQLYLYSIPVYEVYGEYPEYLIFLHFRHDEKKIEKFDLNKLEEAKKWAKERVEYLSSLTEYPPNTKSEFFCSEICGHKTCEYKK